MRHTLSFIITLTLGFATATSPAADEGAMEQPTSAASCAACHGADGNAPATFPTYPNLAGQHADYIAQQLAYFKSGERQNAMMAGMVVNLSEQDMAELGAWYASKEHRVGVANPALVERGEQLWRGGDTDSGVPACMACHGPTGAGNPGAMYPLLSGQNAGYTEAQLIAYRDGTRAAGLASVMQTISQRLTPDDIKALASYIQGLH